MRILFYLLVFGLLPASHAALAQPGVLADSTPEERAEMQTKYMAEMLSLTDSTRIDQIQAINLRYAHRNQDVINSGGRRMSKLRKLKSLNEEKERELKRVLTEEQFAVYQRNKEAMREKMKERAKERRPEGS